MRSERPGSELMRAVVVRMHRGLCVEEAGGGVDLAVAAWKGGNARWWSAEMSTSTLTSYSGDFSRWEKRAQWR